MLSGVQTGNVAPHDKYNNIEYERQGPAPRRGLAPPVLIFQTSPSCNIFTKIPKLVPALTQRADFWPIICLNYLIWAGTENKLIDYDFDQKRWEEPAPGIFL